MSKENLKQVVSTRGVNLQGNNPQNLFARAFDEALSKVGTIAGFEIY
jgi:hypothetical protein